MAEHTTGPFTVNTEQRARWADNEAILIFAADGKTPVAAAADFNRTDRDAEVEANARLFAAAPELLAALANIVVLGHYPDCEVFDRRAFGEHCTCGIETAEAAIAKARGEA